MNPELLKLIIGAVVRSAMISLGTLLASHGLPWLSDSALNEVIATTTGTVVVLVTSLWSILQKKVAHEQLKDANNTIVALVNDKDSNK